MKAILVIDMPTNCRGCDKLVRKGCLKGDYRKDERPKQCPLKPLPSSLDWSIINQCSNTESFEYGRCCGRQELLDEILEEEEEK